MTSSEYDRLAAAAQAAFDAGQPQNFQLTGTALRLAKGDQALVEAARMHFLVMAFNRHLAPPGRSDRLH